MAIKYNGKNVINRKTEEEKRREQEEKETRQKELQEKQLGLPSYMFKYAPPDLNWEPTGTAQKGQITSVKQKSSGLIYPAAQLALKAKYKRDQVEEQLKNAGKVTISGGNAFVPGDKSVKMPEVGSKDGNKAVGREVGDSDLGLRTSKEVLNSFLSFLEKENKSAQDVIDNPDIAENDPEKIKAQKDQTRLKEYQKNALTQLDALPKETDERQPMITTNYTPEENAFTQKIQAGQNKQAQQGYQPIPKVLSKEAQYMWHITHVPQDTEGEDYVKWLQDGMDLGLYDRKDVNAEIAQTGNTTPYDEYKALAEEYKSGAWNYRYNKQQQNIVGLEKAWEYADSYQYGSDRGRLEEELKYYTGQLDEANKLIAGHDSQQENQIRVNLNNLNSVELILPGEPIQYLTGRNEEYNNDINYKMWADEAFYDAVMGQGAYNDVLDYNDAHQKNRELDEALDKKLDEAWTAFEEGRKDDIYNILTGSKTSLGDYVSQRNYAENKIQETQAKLKKYDQIDAALSQYDGISGADYDPALDRGRETLWTYDDEYHDPNVPYASPFTTDVHRIYSFINKGKEYQAYLDFVAGGNVDNAKVSEAYGKSALMNKEMKRKFNDLYRQGKYDEAAAFLNGISVYLNEMYSDYEHIYTEELARQLPITSSIYATGSEMVSGAAGIARTFAGMAGDKSVEDPNSAWYASTRKSEQIQQGIADMIGGTGGKVYLAGMNTLRNMMNAATISALGITGPWASAAGLTLFAAQIYQDQTYKYLEETHDYNKAVSYALLDALLETLEEKLPYDTMLNGGPNLLKNILANVGSEMGEEFTGATLFDTIKGMIKGEDEIENRKDQIFNEGGFVDGSGNWTALDKTNENEAMAKAQIQAMREKGQEIIENTLSGGLGGGLGGFYGVWQNYNENKYWGKKIRGRQNIIGNETGADQLINAALGMKDDTASKKLALKISENANNGKEASDAQIGKLARTMATETNTKIADIAWGAVKWKIHRELTEAGASPEYAGEAAPILADAVMGDGKMNKSDVAAVAKDKRGIEVLKSWLVRGSEKTEEALEEKAGKDTMKANRTVKSLLQGENKYVYSGFVAREINDAHKSANMAGEDVIATAKGRRTGRGTDAVWTTADQGDQIVQVIGKEGNKYRIKTEDGNTQLVDAGSLQAASDVLGTVMELGNRNNIKLEDEAVNAILRGYEANKGLSGEKYVNDAINAYLRFRTGGTMEKSSLTDETLEQIRGTAEAVNKREHENNLAEGKNQLMTAPGKGTIVYQNESGEHKFGSFAWKNALKGLDANRRTQANALAQLTTMIGTHVVLKYEPGSAAFGWEDSGTGRIVINLAATDSSGSSRHILTIAAHEMTHWLQQNSDEGYRELRQFVFDQLRKQGGEDAVEKLIMMTMDDYRNAARNSNNKNFELPSIERAMAEVVANACDQVLSNTKLIETLQNENPNLYEKVRGFVADFVKRIQDAIGNEELYNDSRESRLLKKAGQEVFDQLQEKWMIARNEAVNRERTPGTTKENGQQFAIRQVGSLAAAADAQSPAHTSETTDRSSTSTEIILTPYEEYVKNKKARELSEEEIRLNKEYNDAVESGDEERARRMIWEKITNTKGIYPFIVARENYDNKTKEITNLIKGNENQKPSMNAVHTAAVEMSKKLTDNAVLVPMPGRHGIVENDSDTMLLAKEIGAISGKPVIVALEGVERGSRHEAKLASYKHVQGVKMPMAKDMGFHQVAEIPEGKVPFIVDNVVSVGETAKAAIDAIPGSMVLAFSKGKAEKVVWGLKSADITKENGETVPYNERIRIKDRNWRHSVQQIDDAYMAAVNAGDMEEAQRMVDAAAKRAGYTLEVFHGTGEYFNVFNLGQEGIHLGNKEQASQVASLRYDRRSRYTQYKWGDIRNSVDKMTTEQRESLVNNAYSLGDYIEDYGAIPPFEGSLENAKDVADYVDNATAAYAKTDNIDKEDVKLRMLTFNRKTGENVMRLYSKISNPFVINGDLQEWLPYRIAETLLLRANGKKVLRRYGNNINVNGSEIKLTDGEKLDLSGIMNDYNVKDEQWDKISEILEAHGYDGIKYMNKYEGDKNSYSYIALRQSDVKSADIVTYDDDGNVIPLSERFNRENPDIRYSVSQGEISNDSGEVLAEEIGEDGVARSYSIASWTDKEQATVRKKLLEAGYDKDMVDSWMTEVNDTAAIIMGNPDKLNYVADEDQRFLKPNDEYTYTLDASTLCDKRRVYQGTFNEIQKRLPNTVLLPEELIDLSNMMSRMGYKSPCGICYVESRRRWLGKFTEEFISQYRGKYKPTLADLTTTDGLKELKKNHPEVHDAYIKAMNKKGSANPKVVQLRTDYRGDVRKMRADTVKKLNDDGGLRIQSFSDFEIVHTIDMMQAIMDMAAKGLKGQAYTKVPAFAWIFGDTGVKINLSLIGEGTGLDKNGFLIFSSKEGMDFDEAMKIRKRYGKNVGTILVGISDEHILAAMADDRIDFIIPFHKSGWSQNELDRVDTLKGYNDYTEYQNERWLVKDENGDYIKDKNGRYVSEAIDKKIGNLYPKDYWSYDKGVSGTENARRYLEKCAEEGRLPKFWNFLHDNGDGNFSLQEDGSTDGYWKTLIDFKMYDNEGNPSEQTVVQPIFNMKMVQKFMEEYEGGANGLPAAMDVVDEFVKQYKENHPRKSYSIDQGDMNVQVWLQGLTEGSLSTAQEKTMLRQYQDLKKGLDVMRGLNEERRRKLEKLLAKPNPSAYDRKQIRDLQAVIQAKQREIDRQEEKLAKVTGDKGFARLMYTQAKIMEDLVNGRTADDVRHTVDAISRELETVKKEMAERSEQLKTLAAKEAVIRIRQQLNSAGLKRIAAKLKTDLNSNLSNTEIENRLALMALKMKEGKVDSDEVTELADMLIGKMNPAYDSYVLETLRGRTITLNKNQLAELKGQNRTVREIQQELAGTGIRIRTTGGNTLDQNWDELCDLLPQLNREASDADMLDNLLDLVASERRAARAEGANNDQVAAMVVTAAADLIPEIVTDKKSMQLIRETLKYIAEMSRQAGETAKAMEELNSLMDRLQTKGRQAKSTLGTLENKIHDAIEYNNKLTEQSEAATWKEERRKLINSLNSEHAQAMIAQQQEFRERIEKDRKARNTQAENAALRRRINTNITRVRALLMRESAQKNIPEHMKPLARHMLEKIVNNDLVGRKISGISREDLQETKRVLDAWKAQDGEYNPDSLKGLDDAVQDALYNAVEDLISGIEYYNEPAKGHSLQENLDRYNGALTEISNAVSTITGIINAERTISLGDRRVLLDDMAYKVQESTGGRRAKEFTGRAGLAIANLRKAVVSGNLTPEYFFRTLKNAGLDDLWEEYHRAENRNGLELMKAQTKLDEIAKKYGYKNWDMDKRLTVKLDSGDVSMTMGQIMSLYATWKREHTLGPAMSNHLQMGGFYVEENDPRQGFLGRRVVDLKAHRVNEQDMQLVQSLMTDEQQQFVDEIVSYMSNEMSELGNEASMKAYGIKMYKESYYFPFKMWDGIKARASNDSGSAAAANERAFHPSFSKTRLRGANNAVMIGDFMTTAADHIVGMINYATMGLANENLQRVLNKQVPEGDRLDTMTKRTIRTVLQEAYGKEATDYLAKLQEQLNGGVSRMDRTLYDRALTLFRKNAVAGSMSVALQQPLSYIRAAMMINPKYLAGALSPVYWRGSFKEMMAHSGVAVIKKMGRFDMGFGAGAREFITPEGKEGRVRQAWDAVTEKATILPELMDQMTWTRMWSAVKMEQHALHPEMDVHSDAFLDMVGERFNDVMRKTQVYDSTLTKSQNMRSQNPFVKSITSFMAEPTLTLNVLADAARNAGENGGKVRLAKALATFALSAAAQAAVKAIMSSGRSPDDKKTWYENFAYRFWTNLIQEADVANLVPGYNDLIMLLKNGKLDDDAMGAIGKIFTAFEKMTQVTSPDKINDYRAWEDGPAQIIQLFSQLPAKNIMRDLRAMYNWFIGKPYAQRENSAAVLKLQRDAAAMTADNLIGVIVAKLGEAGYKTTNNAYYGRMFQAMQRGDQAEADQIREYLELAKGVDDKKIESGLRSQARDNLAPAESSQWMIDNDLMDGTGTITTQYKEGDITADEAKKLYKAADPELSDDDIWWKIDRADYQKETGKTETGYYYRLGPALETNRSEQINAVIKDLLQHGKTKEQVKTQINTELKQKYLEADNSGRVRIRDEMQKAYKAAGYTVDDANKQIEKWKKDAEKKK